MSQRLPQDMLCKISTFILRVRKMRLLHHYSLSCIGNMDETPLWLDMPGDTTISRVGERSVSIRTTGHDKGRFTVILAAMADGRKLKPFVVFKGVRAIPELSHVPNVVVALSRNGWMNEALTVQWIDSVWGRLSFQRRLLVWDAYRCHMTEKVKDHIQRQTKSDTCLIPGGLTSQLQPADLSWNKPFKAAYRELYNTWMASGEKSFTAAGNMKAPDKILCLQWVKKAWESVTREVIVNSFKSCGISVETDGSEDGQIHCIKPGQVAADAAATIQSETARLSTPTEDESDSDPFLDLDELEDDETVVDDN